jgi:hypothetical protein
MKEMLEVLEMLDRVILISNKLTVHGHVCSFEESTLALVFLA